MATPSIDLLALVSAFEGAIDTDNAAAQSEVNAQTKFDAAQVALGDAKTAHVGADAAVYETGQSLVAGIQALIAPFAPPVPPPAE